MKDAALQEILPDIPPQCCLSRYRLMKVFYAGSGTNNGSTCFAKFLF